MTRRPYRGGGGPPDSGVLSERVDGLQADFASFRSEIGSTLKALSDKFDERSRTPWGHIWSAAGVLMTVLVALGGLAFYPVSQGQTALAKALDTVSERMVTEKELGAVVANAAARRDDAQRQTEARFARAEADIDGLQKSVVPRGEHEREQAEQRRVDDGLEREIADLRDRLKGYVPAEAVAPFVKQLDDLQRRFNATRG